MLQLNLFNLGEAATGPPYLPVIMDQAVSNNVPMQTGTNIIFMYIVVNSVLL